MSIFDKYRVPSFCPVCGNLMRENKCIDTYYRYGCCADCEIAFVDDREEEWKNGWRPSKEEINKYYKKLYKNYKI